MRISDWSSDVCSSDLHKLNVFAQTSHCRYFRYCIKRTISKAMRLVVPVLSERATKLVSPSKFCRQELKKSTCHLRRNLSAIRFNLMLCSQYAFRPSSTVVKPQVISFIALINSSS